MGGTQFQRSHDQLQHCLSLLKDLIIPETKHTKTLGLQSAISLLVVTDAFLMLSTIEFNGKLRLQACEVGDESRNGNLPPKPVAAQLFAAQLLPKVSLRVRGPIAQVARMVLQFCVTHIGKVWRYCPFPNPPPLCKGGS